MSEIVLYYEISNDKNDYERRVKLKDLFIENNFDILQIQFKQAEACFAISSDEWSLCQLGAIGWGLFPNNFDFDKTYILYEGEYQNINYYTTYNILEMCVDLSSFYDDPTPFDFTSSPRISSKYVAGYFWNEIVKANK